MRQRKTRRRRICAAGMVLFLLIMIFCAFNHGLVTRRYAVSSAKLKNTDPLRLVLLTDLHSCVYGDRQQTLYQRIERERPDLILLGGDIADDVQPLEGALQLVERIAGLAPCYYVPGSHDMWRADYEDVCRRLASMGVTILENAVQPLEIRGQRIVLCGAIDPTVPFQDDPARYGESLQAAFANLHPEDYNILLAHRPDFIAQYASLGFDLVLSGHTHGGQVRIPFLVNGLYAPGQGWFPRYAGGEYRVGETDLIVSRGLSHFPRLPRIFNPPEVVVVNLAAK